MKREYGTDINSRIINNIFKEIQEERIKDSKEVIVDAILTTFDSMCPPLALAILYHDSRKEMLEVLPLEMRGLFLEKLYNKITLIAKDLQKYLNSIDGFIELKGEKLSETIEAIAKLSIQEVKLQKSFIELMDGITLYLMSGEIPIKILNSVMQNKERR